jgi:hypothetical protein
MSVHLSFTQTWEPQNRFSWHFVLGGFTKLSQNISLPLKTEHGNILTSKPTIYMRLCGLVKRNYLAKYLSVEQMVATNFIDKYEAL